MSLAAGSAGDDIVKMAPPIDFIGKPCGECGPATSSERARLRSIVDAAAAKRSPSPRTKRRRRQMERAAAVEVIISSSPLSGQTLSPADSYGSCFDECTALDEGDTLAW